MSHLSAPAPTPGKVSIGRVEYPKLSGLFAAVGMWILWHSGNAAATPMPFKQLEIFRSIGLSIFQSPFGLRAMFWFAVFLHVVEGGLAFRDARQIQQRGRMDKQWSLTFSLFWLVQTSLFGYPSLRLIQRQKREQTQAIENRNK